MIFRIPFFPLTAFRNWTEQFSRRITRVLLQSFFGLKFEVFPAVSMNCLVWVMTPSNLALEYQSAIRHIDGMCECVWMQTCLIFC